MPFPVQLLFCMRSPLLRCVWIFLVALPVHTFSRSFVTPILHARLGPYYYRAFTPACTAWILPFWFSPRYHVPTLCWFCCARTAAGFARTPRFCRSVYLVCLRVLRMDLVGFSTCRCTRYISFLFLFTTLTTCSAFKFVGHLHKHTLHITFISARIIFVSQFGSRYHLLHVFILRCLWIRSHSGFYTPFYAFFYFHATFMHILFCLHFLLHSFWVHIQFSSATVLHFSRFTYATCSCTISAVHAFFMRIASSLPPLPFSLPRVRSLDSAFCVYHARAVRAVADRSAFYATLRSWLLLPGSGYFTAYWPAFRSHRHVYGYTTFRFAAFTRLHTAAVAPFAVGL